MDRIKNGYYRHGKCQGKWKENVSVLWKFTIHDAGDVKKKLYINPLSSFS